MVFSPSLTLAPTEQKTSDNGKSNLKQQTLNKQATQPTQIEQN